MAAKRAYTGVINAEEDCINLWEMFIVHDVGNNEFALQSHHKSFLSAKDSGGSDITASVFHVLDWEKFRFIVIEKLDNNVWVGCFQCRNGSYVTINHAHKHFYANAKNLEEAGRFRVRGIH